MVVLSNAEGTSMQNYCLTLPYEGDLFHSTQLSSIVSWNRSVWSPNCASFYFNNHLSWRPRSIIDVHFLVFTLPNWVWSNIFFSSFALCNLTLKKMNYKPIPCPESNNTMIMISRHHAPFVIDKRNLMKTSTNVDKFPLAKPLNIPMIPIWVRSWLVSFCLWL